MPASRRLLILGGTGEARALADALADRPGLYVVNSLAGRTAEPRRPRGEIRIGGFGGPAGLAAYLDEAQIDLVVNATHPYAAAISAHAAEACLSARRPLLRLERPAWRPRMGDRWVIVDSPAAAAKAATHLGTRAFLAIGAKQLAAFADIDKIWFLVRLVELPPDPLPLRHYEITVGRGPFEQSEERGLIRRYHVHMVIAKNSGGNATYGKIAAARDLGLPVLFLRRPVLPAGETAESTAEAIAWIEEKSG